MTAGEHQRAKTDAGTQVGSLLRLPVFRRLWMTLVVFNLGHLVQVVVSSWLMLEMTNSPLWVSAMIGAPTLPLLVLSLPAGAAADLFDRRVILMSASGLLAAAATGMAVLSANDMLTPTRLVALGLGIGVGISFFNPAWQALVPSLLPSSLVPGAVSLNSAAGGIATALGPAAGGVLLATVGAEFSFAVAAVTYLSLGVVVATSSTAGLDQANGSLTVAIAAGIRYLRFSRGYLWLLMLGTLFGFSSASLRSMLPNLTNDVFDGGSALYGVLLGTFGGGAMLGGVTREFARGLVGRQVLPASMMAFGALGIAIGLSPLLPLTVVAIALSGLLWTWILATLNSTYQMLTPDWVRGRTMGAFVLSVFGFAPLGSIAAGAVGSEFGAATSIVLFSAGVVGVGALALAMPIPVLDEIDPPVLIEPDLAAVPEVEDGDAQVMVVNTWSVAPDDAAAFLERLSDLRRVRMRTGASRWHAYWDAADSDSISEVFVVPTWDQRVQQIKRLDADAMEVLRSVDRLARPTTAVRHNLVLLDLSSTALRRSDLEVPKYPDHRRRAP